MMKNVRSIAAIAFAALLLGAATQPVYADPPGRGFYSSEDGRSRDRGSINGQILGVDYGRGQLLVGNRHGRIPLVITPSTTILRGRDYATLTDLAVGMNVQIEANEVDGRLIAQIIRILP